MSTDHSALKNQLTNMLFNQNQFSFRHYMVFILFLFGTIADLAGQGKFTLQERIQYRKANLYLAEGKYADALPMYQDLYRTDSISPKLNQKLGECVYRIGNNDPSASIYFKKASDAGHKDSYLWLAKCYHLQRQFDEAMLLYAKHISSSGKMFPEEREKIDRYIGYSKTAKKLTGSPSDIGIENLGTIINSTYSDYVPLLIADESKLLFIDTKQCA